MHVVNTLIQMFLFDINKDLKTEKVCMKNQVFKTSMKKKHLWYNKIQERDEILGNILKFKNMSSTKPYRMTAINGIVIKDDKVVRV